MIHLLHGDCRDFLSQLPVHGERTIFMDPPDNLGLKYSEYDDRVEDSRYYDFLYRIIDMSLLRCKVLWVSYYWKHDLEIKYMVRNLLKHEHPSWSHRQFLWKFTFSQYQDNDCAPAFRYILRLNAPGVVFNTEGIRIPSERMKIGDKRAAGERVPDTIWEYPRVVGNAEERRSWHPTQHPQKLMERIVAMSPGLFVDLFVGSGTSIRACRYLNRDILACEIDDGYVSQLEQEFQIKRAGI